LRLLSNFLSAGEQRGDIIIQGQSRSHASDHRGPDVLMSTDVSTA
jgi:hypothetical protein